MRRPAGALASVAAAAALMLLASVACAQQQPGLGPELEAVPWEWNNPVMSGYMAAQEAPVEEGVDIAVGVPVAGVDGGKQAAGGWWGWGVRGAARAPAPQPPKPPVYEMPVVKPEEVNVSSELLGRLQPALDKFVQERKLPGAVVMVARHGKIIADVVSGYDHGNYIFRMFSQSKPVTAAATMILVDDGAIGLDDPVTKYLPEFRGLRVIKNGTAGASVDTEPLKRQMTIRHLLTHTSGLVYGDGGDSVVDEMYRAVRILDIWDQDLNGFIEKLARLPLLTHPGTEWRYSVGFDVLGAIIQRVTKKPLEVFMKERLFDPLDMNDTGFWVPPAQLSRLVVYMSTMGGPGTMTPIPFSYTHTDFSRKPRLMSGGGGLVSTARDYLRFGQMLLNRGQLGGVRILKKETVELMWQNQLPPSMKPFKMGPVTFKTSDFGLGMAIQNKYLPAMAVVGEAGWGGAASTNWWASPDTDTVIVAMTQVAPFFNGLAETARPITYTSLLDWEPPVDVVVSVPKGDDELILTAPSDREAAKYGMGPIELAEWDEVLPDGSVVKRGSLKGARPAVRKPGAPTNVLGLH